MASAGGESGQRSIRIGVDRPGQLLPHAGVAVGRADDALLEEILAVGARLGELLEKAGGLDDGARWVCERRD